MSKTSMLLCLTLLLITISVGNAGGSTWSKSSTSSKGDKNNHKHKHRHHKTRQPCSTGFETSLYGSTTSLYGSTATSTYSETTRSSSSSSHGWSKDSKSSNGWSKDSTSKPCDRSGSWSSSSSSEEWPEISTTEDMIYSTTEDIMDTTEDMVDTTMDNTESDDISSTYNTFIPATTPVDGCDSYGEGCINKPESDIGGCCNLNGICVSCDEPDLCEDVAIAPCECFSNQEEECELYDCKIEECINLSAQSQSAGNNKVIRLESESNTNEIEKSFGVIFGIIGCVVLVAICLLIGGCLIYKKRKYHYKNIGVIAEGDGNNQTTGLPVDDVEGDKNIIMDNSDQDEVEIDIVESAALSGQVTSDRGDQIVLDALISGNNISKTIR